jgi:S1-C subfamily serine protease
MSDNAHGRPGMKVILGMMLALNLGLVGFLVLRGTDTTRDRPQPVESQPSLSDGPPPLQSREGKKTAASDGADLLPEERHVIGLFETLSPSVVYITTMGATHSYFGARGAQPQGAGSGFVWDDKGHIVTNFHVIAQAEEAVVTLADGSEWPARLTGAAPDQDLAVLKIEAPASRLPAIPVGNSKGLRVGQFAMAIGNPFGLDQTLTTGVISALDRQIESISGRQIYGVIQTDAAINPGNSGGPLINSAGRLIGVNTAIKSASGSSAGIGFAVPVDTVNRIVPQLIESGRVTRPGLGVLLANDQIAARFGVEGAVVRGVNPGSPAEGAGIVGLEQDRWGRVRLGDVIVGVDEETVRNVDDLLKVMDGHEVGDEVRVELDRNGARRTVKLRLARLD